MRRNTIAGLLMMVTLCLCVPTIVVAVPNIMSYQGKLNDRAGNPINGSKNITFTIYDVASGGTALWTETQNVVITNGILNVELGSVAVIPDSLFNSDNRYIGIKIGTDSEMTPRQRITSGAYSFKSKSSETSDRMLNYLGLVNLRSLELGTSNLGGGLTDGWGEVYIDSNGKYDSVIGGTALYDNQLLKFVCNFIGNASVDTTSNPNNFVNPNYAFDNNDSTAATIQTSSSNATYTIGKIFPAKSISTVKFVAETTINQGSGWGSGVKLQSFNGSTWSDIPNTSMWDNNGGVGKFAKISYINSSIQGVRAQFDSLSTIHSFTLYSLEYGIGEIESTIVHSIPVGALSGKISKSIGIPLIDNWEAGADIQYKLSNASEDTGWLPAGNNPLSSTFTTFTSQPTTLTVKLIPKSSNPTGGFPSIKGFWVYAE
ncbi:MAG: hypothetical protein WCP20_22900 [Desulfuromonadales bacterium]